MSKEQNLFSVWTPMVSCGSFPPCRPPQTPLLSPLDCPCPAWRTSFVPSKMCTPSIATTLLLSVMHDAWQGAVWMLAPRGYFTYSRNTKLVEIGAPVAKLGSTSPLPGITLSEHHTVVTLPPWPSSHEILPFLPMHVSDADAMRRLDLCVGGKTKHRAELCRYSSFVSN